MRVRHVLAAVAVLAVAAALPVPSAAAGEPPPRAAVRTVAAPPSANSEIREMELAVPTDDGLLLPATLHVPVDAPPGLPGMVLVHGAGPGPRDKYRAEAEAFARAGIATLTYDKRSVGYSLVTRSYSRLAEDALAAADLLRSRPEVAPDGVGIWGFSEGGWVAPLAAARAPETAFLVVVGANGVAPLRQQTWADAAKFDSAGVRGSLVDAASRTSYRLAAGMGMFPEPYFDPRPALHALTLPVLGVWGAKDRLTPPVESVTAYRDGLDGAGNRRYALHVVDDAEHSLRRTTDGFDKGAEFAPGYVDLVVSWVRAAVSGAAPPARVVGAGEQPRATADVPPLAWYESVWVHAGALVLLLVGFAAPAVAAAGRRLRGRAGAPLPWSARLLAGAGLGAVLGTLGYLGWLMATRGRTVEPGPMLAGRPLPWLGLQALAVVAVAAGVALALRRRRTGATAGSGTGLLLTAGVVFVPWALYWGLLVP
jgi:pimeloyl-ACP methyl ester carboxylesterase